MSEKRESEIFDNGRRGEPLISCDCITCFGYCVTDATKLQWDRTQQASDDLTEAAVND